MKPIASIQLVAVTILASIALALAGATAYAQPNVLIAAGDTAGPDELKTYLTATGLIGQIDIVDTSSTTPTVATMNNYDAVLIYCDFAPLDTVTFGNNLATYVAGGRGVVELPASSTTTWGVHGTWDSRSCIVAADVYSLLS
ncbi:MAG: hypothetical protein AB7S36_07500, partial [Planctomycetota bacterium]